jgi:DNA replication protein DnaC
VRVFNLIITASQLFSAWDSIFPDGMMTLAAIDRLLHHAAIIELEGVSYRKKNQLNQVKK